MESVALTIDGIEVEVAPGTTVLEAAQQAGVYIPTLCADPDLKPRGLCRVCMVEIQGLRGTVTACTTEAQQRMVVRTDSPAIQRIRRTAIELILANHHPDCQVCAKNSDCDLQQVAAYVGVDEERLKRLRRRTLGLPIDDSNPFFLRDLNKCILCAKCVRACAEIVGAYAIDVAFRGYSSEISTFGHRPILDSVCESCGECVVHCPTGALAPKVEKSPSREVKTICPYCGVGCSIYLGVRGDQVVSAEGDRESLVNQGWLCVKGRYGSYEFINHPDRLTTPLIKRNGEFVAATWDEALDLVARRFSEHKGDAFAAISSAKCTNEENYLMQKFARAVMGSNHVDHCARL